MVKVYFSKKNLCLYQDSNPQPSDLRLLARALVSSCQGFPSSQGLAFLRLIPFGGHYSRWLEVVTKTTTTATSCIT